MRTHFAWEDLQVGILEEFAAYGSHVEESDIEHLQYRRAAKHEDFQFTKSRRAASKTKHRRSLKGTDPAAYRAYLDKACGYMRSYRKRRRRRLLMDKYRVRVEVVRGATYLVAYRRDVNERAPNDTETRRDD